MSSEGSNGDGEVEPLILGILPTEEHGVIRKDYDASSLPPPPPQSYDALAPPSPRYSQRRLGDGYVSGLVRMQKVSEKYLRKNLGLPLRERSVLGDLSSVRASDPMAVDKVQLKELHEDCAFLKKALQIRRQTDEFVDVRLERQRSVEVRLKDVSYMVPIDESDGMIETVFRGRIFKAYKTWRAKRQRPKLGAESGPPCKLVLRDINLVLRPGRSYLILGAPGSGKTSLLKAIASRLPENKNNQRLPKLRGNIDYNGLPMKNDKGVVLSNAVAYVDQIDRHEPRLTVEETLDFAYNCKGGTHRNPYMGLRASVRLDEIVATLDKEKTRVRLTMEGFRLGHVCNTYVGGRDVRGVSGGQRRRVTVAEMMMMGLDCPILCGDEVSTGLDAASTYQIVRILARLGRISRTTRVVSLKQPSPETVALFDEMVLLAEGRIIFAGPVPEAFKYFESIGFSPPEDMDDADFLQTLSTTDRNAFYRRGGRCPTAEILNQMFRRSEYGNAIQEKLDETLSVDWSSSGKKNPNEGVGKEGSNDLFFFSSHPQVIEAFRKKFLVSFWRATLLNTKRHFTIWMRDTRFLRANFAKNVVMGLSVGMVFQKTDVVDSILGVMFQSMLFIMLSASTAAPSQIDDRFIFYKHSAHNFYPVMSFVLGRTIAFVPQAVSDVLTFGTIIYALVGLEAAVSNFLIFLAILIVFTISMSTTFGVCTSIAPTKATVQVLSSVIILLNMYFCGFLVAPEVIPRYYGWLYWWTPLSWAYRALLVNEYLGPSYDYPVRGTNMSAGEWVLLSKGFTFHGDPFRREWIGYCFAYLVPYSALMMLLSGLGLALIRYNEVGKDAGRKSNEGDVASSVASPQLLNVPFVPVHLTFEGLSYEVDAPRGKDKLKLLNDVYGHLQPGRMCALMGESGAGKSTLMDVIALRKQSGKVTGEVRLNGHLQEKVSFRRCSGYVEQFDVQSPQLTVRETIAFSAHMRLDSRADPSMKHYKKRDQFVDNIIRMMELGPQESLLVGDDETGGLSFDQRKRLSIAVELAASPSVIFLDEPTSGLDSRAALMVVRSLKRIALTGRTVCATIHQPSSAVFSMFDDLLLMKKGGHCVYAGALGHASQSVVNYFESRGAVPISHGENPATWMLSGLTAERNACKDQAIDFEGLYECSDERKKLATSIAQVQAAATDQNKISYRREYARSNFGRNMLMRRRLDTIYWRSPAYNRSRIVLSLVLSFLLSSVFVNKTRRPEIMSETYISGIFSTIFISFIIVGIMAITTVLPVMQKVRDVFYCHRASGMLDHWSLTWALASAEQVFILFTSAMYCAVFYFTIGLELDFGKFVAFWGFFTFNLAINSYFGQAFMCVVPGLATASILCSVVIGMNNFFSGLIVRPQYLHGFWQVPYWITPGRYVYEGLIAPQFYNDHRIVVANHGSDFHDFLDCSEDVTMAGKCHGTVAQYMLVFFGGRFHADHTALNASVLGIFLVLARMSTHVALHKFNYMSA
mmetsp:Transcript_60004/g.177918  ORF Transcript_60004/g.177918 Transcript_60004/m.177918 type:complete len:1485 (-) Transcript_60004:28-4482(-)